MAIDVAVDQIGDLVPEGDLGHMRIDIDDEIVAELLRVLRGMGEDVARVAAHRDPRQLAHRRRDFTRAVPAGRLAADD